MKQLAILLSLAFVFTSCDSVLSPESGTTETQKNSFLPPPSQLMQAPGQGRWVRQESGTAESLFSVHFADARNGWTVGTNGIILHTFDGGRTWTRQKSGTDEHLETVQFIDAQTGWMSGYPLFRTTDGGQTWQPQESGGGQDFYFIDAQTGWKVANETTIFNTTDGGQTWQRQVARGDLDWLHAVHFTDARNGWAAGWSGQSFKDNEELRSAILHTSDGGATWTRQQTNGGRRLFSIYFVDPQKGWAVGSHGILHTSDGGQTWQPQERSGSSELLSVHFTDARNGWAVGDNGTILHYSAGQEEPPPPAEPSAQTIYEEQLNAPWINASWSAKVDFASTEQARSGSRSIRVDQQTWGALSVRNGRWGDPQNIEPGSYEQVTFAVYAQQPVRLDLRLENEQGNKFPRVRYGTVEPGAWTVVSVPLAKLNPEGRSWNRVDILESGGQPVTYFVDDFVLAGPPPTKQEPEVLTVYQDALSEPWFNASWSASVDYKNSTQTHSGSYSIRVDQRAWGALSLRSGRWGDPQNIEPGSYEQVTFAVYAQQPLTVDLILENEEGTEFPRVRYGTIEAGSWTIVSVPLAELNPGGQPFNRIDITESSGQAKTYFVDELKLEESSGSEPMAAR